MSPGSKCLLCGVAMIAATGAFADVVRNPLHAGAALEEFQLFKSANTLDQDPAFSPPVLMVRPTGWVFGSATVDERLDIVFGLGATLFSIPADSGQHPSGYQNEVYPAVAMVQASGSYTWGDLARPSLKVAFGEMPYKYSPDAREFGEYLFRSTPYPGSVLNSPFDVVNGAQTNLLGGILSKDFLDGKWKNDILLTSVNNFFPLGDLNLTYVTRFRPNPVFEIGGGISFYRLIPLQPEISTYKTGKNAYYTFGGKKYSANSEAYAVDSLNPQDTAIVNRSKEVVDSLDDGTSGTLPAGVSDVHYFSLKGQMLMARFSLDLKPLLGDAVDLKLYGEWSMLGVQNRPIFYEKPIERMPMTLGVDLPTWGVLDLLNAEAEYWKNPYINSDYPAAYYGYGTPNLIQNAYNNVGLKSTKEKLSADDLRWSLSAKKTFGGAFSILAKASSDHMQVMQFHTSSFDKSYGDVMSRDGSWYYALRFQVAI